MSRFRGFLHFILHSSFFLVLAVSQEVAADPNKDLSKDHFHFSNGSEVIYRMNSLPEGNDFKIEFIAQGGQPTVIYEGVELQAHEEEPSDRKDFTWFSHAGGQHYVFDDGSVVETGLSGWTQARAAQFTFEGFQYIVESLSLPTQKLTMVTPLSKHSRFLVLDKEFHEDLVELVKNRTLEGDLEANPQENLQQKRISFPKIKTQLDLKNFKRVWRIQDQDETFLLSSEGGPKDIWGTYLKRLSDGLELKVSEEDIPNIEMDSEIFKESDGILSLSPFKRDIDLRAFDAEVRLASKRGKAQKIVDDKGVSLNATEEVLNQYQDLVADARSHPKSYQEESDFHLNRKIVRALLSFRSPVLLGAAGTGKTSAVRAFARDVSVGRVPGIPRTLKIVQVDLSSLSSGTRYVGTIEQRVGLIKAAAKESGIIFFIDEIHSMTGVGTSEFQSNDVTQYIKQPMELEELLLIGTDTDHEFGNAFSKDPAFMQRFDRIQLASPEEEALLRIIKSRLKATGSKVPSDLILRRAIELSDRCDILSAQPRAAVNLLKTACSEMLLQNGPSQGLTAEVLEAVAIEKYQINPASLARGLGAQKIEKLKKAFEGEIIGQAPAQEALISLWKRAITGVGDPKVVNSVLLVGGSGFGKTKILRVSSKAMSYQKKSISMSSYSNGDVEGFLRELYAALLKNPFTVFILDDIEKAKSSVQDAVLSLLEKGEFVVNERLSGGEVLLQNVSAKNALFLMTSTAGTSYLRRNASKAEDIDETELRGILIQSGISPGILSRILSVTPMMTPSKKELQKGLESYLDQVLARESKRAGTEIELKNKDEFIAEMIENFDENRDFRQIRRMVQPIEEKIADARLSEGHSAVEKIQITWEKKAVRTKSVPIYRSYIH